MNFIKFDKTNTEPFSESKPQVPLKLLKFGENPQQFQTKNLPRTSAISMLSQRPKREEAGTQASLDSFPTSSHMNLPKDFLEVVEIEPLESQNLQVNYTTGDVLLPQAKSSWLVEDIQGEPVPKWVSPEELRDQQESELLHKEEALRLTDPFQHYKETHEYRQKVMNQRIQELDQIATKLEQEMSQCQNQIEEIDQEYTQELDQRKRSVALDLVQKLETRATAAEEDGDQDRVSYILAANKQLYEDIDKNLQSALEITESQETPKQPVRTKKPGKKVPALVSRRIGKAMQTASQLIQVSRRNY